MSVFWSKLNNILNALPVERSQPCEMGSVTLPFRRWGNRREEVTSLVKGGVGAEEIQIRDILTAAPLVLTIRQKWRWISPFVWNALPSIPTPRLNISSCENNIWLGFSFSGYFVLHWVEPCWSHLISWWMIAMFVLHPCECRVSKHMYCGLSISYFWKFQSQLSTLIRLLGAPLGIAFLWLDSTGALWQSLLLPRSVFKLGEPILELELIPQKL